MSRIGFQVNEKNADLIAQIASLKNITIEDIIAFEAEFEFINPFQDGNGRVGRLIALKECLRHQIVPFLLRFYTRDERNRRHWFLNRR